MKKVSNFQFPISNLLRHPLFSGSVVMVVGNLFVNGINYLYHLIMGRVLGPASYGVLVSLYSILYITSMIPVSTSVAIVRFISGAKDASERGIIYTSIKSFIFKLAVALSLIVLVTSPFFAKFLNISNFWEVALVSPILFLSLLTLVNQATLQGVLKFREVVAPNFISSLTKLVFGVLFVILGFSVIGAMWGVLLGALFGYLLSTRFIKKIGSLVSRDSFSLKPFFSYSFPVLIQSAAFTSLFTTDLILVKHFFPPFEAGLYAAASTLGKIVFFAVSPITSTMFPIVAGRKAKGQGYGKVFLISFMITFLLSFLIVAFYFIFPRLAIVALYGEGYLSLMGSLGWMGIFMGLYSLSYLLTNFFLSIGKIKASFLPLVAAMMQILGIILFHGTILTVIIVSTILTTLLVISLLIYLANVKAKGTA